MSSAAAEVGRRVSHELPALVEAIQASETLDAYMRTVELGLPAA